ncbi:MAG TPA: 50S ribosomal protein L24 [Patescibacteria group bacterium]|nr:50S ribosomal protein L24 [Patescibacteria group bacterium]
MKIKKGDKVKMLSGKDKGKTGKVLQVLKAEKRVSVEGLNLLVKHLRPRREGEKGQKVEFPALVAISKLMLVCPKCQKETRVEYKLVKTDTGNKKYRQCKKCHETFA